MSKLLKEKIIYIIGMALGLLTLAFFFIPYMTVVTKEVDEVTKQIIYTPTVLNGWAVMFGGIDCINGNEAEGIFLVLTCVVALASVANLVLGLLCYLAAKKNPDAKIGKKWFIILQLIYLAVAFTMTIALDKYLLFINGSQLPVKGWSVFAFYAETGVLSAGGPCLYFLIGASTIAVIASSILAGMVKDNSLVLPYKRREIIASFITIVACIAVFFITVFDYYYSTIYINQNIESIYEFAKSNGGDPTFKYNLYSGYDIYYLASGGLQGYIRLFFYLMQFVAIMGIAYNVVFLLGAFGVLRINFDRKINNTINLALMIMGVMIFVGCVAYCYGVNYQLDSNWAANATQKPLSTIWGDQFPRSYILAGPIVCLYPIASFFGVYTANNFLD